MSFERTYQYLYVCLLKLLPWLLIYEVCRVKICLSIFKFAKFPLKASNFFNVGPKKSRWVGSKASWPLIYCRLKVGSGQGPSLHPIHPNLTLTLSTKLTCQPQSSLSTYFQRCKICFTGLGEFAHLQVCLAPARLPTSSPNWLVYLPTNAYPQRKITTLLTKPNLGNRPRLGLYDEPYRVWPRL